MNIHKNASMTPKGRAHLVKEIVRIGLKPAAAAAGLSVRTARKWHQRFARHGAGALADRSSRPHRSPARSCPGKIERAVALRRKQRLTYDCIAERVGLSRSVVARACKSAGLAKLPPLQGTVAIRRYERARPGSRLDGNQHLARDQRFLTGISRVTKDHWSCGARCEKVLFPARNASSNHITPDSTSQCWCNCMLATSGPSRLPPLNCLGKYWISRPPGIGQAFAVAI